VIRPRYGVDAPAIPGSLAAGGALLLGAAGLRRSPVLAATGSALLASAGVFLHTSLRGKLRVWDRELDRLGLRGDEELLDLGCGRGAVLIAAARRLPRGRAVGVDLWLSRDQSGNAMAVTRRNAEAANVADRVELHTADMTALPFADGSFDVVTSALAIHNIPSPDGRAAAVREALRVLRPGGRLVLVDIHHVDDYVHLIGPEATVHGLGPEYWYGGPWIAARLITATKPRHG
jgi:SAM-dependent methyltransferase